MGTPQFSNHFEKETVEKMSKLTEKPKQINQCPLIERGQDFCFCHIYAAINDLKGDKSRQSGQT